MVQFLDQGRRASKAEARLLRARCLAWLKHTPEELPTTLLPSWGNVVATLVHAEDVLRTGSSSIQRPRAPEALAQWLRWIVHVPSKTLFAKTRGVPLLYASLYRGVVALQHARQYSVTLHDTLVVHEWNPLPLLQAMSRNFEEHRSFRAAYHLSVNAWADTPWLESLIAVFRYTSWRMPSSPSTNNTWAYLTMFTELAALSAQARPELNVRRWKGVAKDSQAMIQKLVECLPCSAAEALAFAREYPELLSQEMTEKVYSMDMRKTSAYAGVSLWLRLRPNERESDAAIERMLAEKFPNMHSTVQAYLHMVQPNETMAGISNLTPAWNLHVLGRAPDPVETIPGDLFAETDG